MKHAEKATANVILLHPDTQTKPSLTRTQRKILDVRNVIYFQPQPDADDMAFSARELVQGPMELKLRRDLTRGDGIAGCAFGTGTLASK